VKNHQSVHLILNVLVGLFFVLIPLLFPPVWSALIASRPLSFVNNGGSAVAVNETLAYDQDASSYANFTMETGTVDYFGFDRFGRGDEEDIRRVDLSIDVEVIGTTNDRWSLAYSVDNGSTYQDIRPIGTGDQSRSFYAVMNLNLTGTAHWHWTNLSDQLLVRVQTARQGTLDGAELRLYEMWINVTADTEGPSINASVPESGANVSNGTVQFGYMVVDQLSGIVNCSLIMNSSINLTNSSIIQTASQNFTAQLDDGIYEWNIRCIDNASSFNVNSSSNRSLLVDTHPPIVTLEGPNDRHSENFTNRVVFFYNVSDMSPIRNCSLMLNGSLNTTIATISTNALQNFTLDPVVNGTYNWSVVCTDLVGWVNESSIRQLDVRNYDAPLEMIALTIAPAFDLIAGSSRIANCSAIVRDNNSVSEIGVVNGTLFRASVGVQGQESNLTHYSNSSCVCNAMDATTSNCTCSFRVHHVAQNGSWACNISAYSIDQHLQATAVGFFNVSPLFSMNVSEGIDFGPVPAYGISQNTTVVLTNLGNNPIRVGVYGYGEVYGDNLSFVCPNGENVTIDSMRYSIHPEDVYDAKTNLTSGVMQIQSYSIAAGGETLAASENLTYWQAQAPSHSLGECAGVVVFIAYPGS
jgi:hypothetical protein